MIENSRLEIRSFRLELNALLDTTEEKVIRVLEDFGLKQKQKIEANVTSLIITKDMLQMAFDLLKDADNSSKVATCLLLM